MKKAARLALFLIVVLSVSLWLVRLWMLLVIPLPISDAMIDFALHVYGAENQEESTDALAWLGLLIVTPVTGLICWLAARAWKRCRREAIG